MLNGYVNEAFSGFECRHKYKITSLDPQTLQKFDIDIEIKPSFMVIDDNMEEGAPG